MLQDERVDIEGIRYDPVTGSYRYRHDWESMDSLSYTVVQVILAVTGADPRSVAPLWDTIDPDALEAILRPSGPAANGQDRVTFTHEGCRVVVQRNGLVTIDRCDSPVR